MNPIKTLVKENKLPQNLRTKPCAIIMGRTGVGKTTLVNKICGTNYKAGAGSGSITRLLYVHDVNYGQKPFSVIDTPGTNSKCETYKHAFLLREALTSKPLHTIFIIIKYDCRFDTMLETYLEQQEPVYNYDNKIVVMISHWDNSKEPEKDFPQICELFEECCSNIICYSEKSLETNIANLMYACISNMTAKNTQRRIFS